MTRTGRPDFDAMVKISSIPADEPIFMLRAQDPAAAAAVRAWASFAKTHGVPAAVLEQALRQADVMDAWPVKKAPAADHLTDGERRRLDYQHDRRAWNANDPLPDERTALAERRGFARGLAVVRPLLTALRGALLSVEWRIGLHAPGGALPDEEEYAALVTFRDKIAAVAIERAEAIHD